MAEKSRQSKEVKATPVVKTPGSLEAYIDEVLEAGIGRLLSKSSESGDRLKTLTDVWMQQLKGANAVVNGKGNKELFDVRYARMKFPDEMQFLEQVTLLQKRGLSEEDVIQELKKL